MYIRNINTMVRKAAPFLKYDSDPYAVILNRQVYWVIDAYTTTDNYPYSQNANTAGVPAGSGLTSTFDYVRNSVKVVISAYTGRCTSLWSTPPTRSSGSTRRRSPTCSRHSEGGQTAFPGITAHFRYPEDLFRVQTTMYGRYHLTKASDFYSQAQAWSVSPDPGSGQLSSSSPLLAPIVGRQRTARDAAGARLAPQYILAHPPGSTQQSFMAVIPYVPVGSSTERQNLTAWMTAAARNPPPQRHADGVRDSDRGRPSTGRG